LILDEAQSRFVRLRTPRPMTYVGLSGFGIEISSTEGLE
jgi:3,4-dihydroxy 2-butanone 4-phosphate synthase/GTP cyclohydrolase II